VLDAPQRIEASGPNGGPIQTEEQQPDFSKLTLEEMLQYEALYRKAHGLPTVNEEYHIIDGGPYTAQKAAATQPALPAGS
jgi:hypothetical protein